MITFQLQIHNIIINHNGQPVGSLADDTLPLGFYKIVYTATDASNNSTQAFRLINLVDETPPVITFKPELQPASYDVGIQSPGDFKINNTTNLIDLFEANDKYYDQPHEVTKNMIIKLNGQVVNTIDENADVGNYKIYFTATDGSGNINNQSIYNVDILVYDNTAPVVPEVQPEKINISTILNNGVVTWTDSEFEKIKDETVDYYDDRNLTEIFLIKQITII